MGTVEYQDGTTETEVFSGTDSEVRKGLYRQHAKALRTPGVTLIRQWPRIGRNDTCPCGSGAKFKKCHLAMAG